MLSVVNAGSDIMDALRQAENEVNTILKYEIRPMYDRLTNKMSDLDQSTKEKLQSEFTSLEGAIQKIYDKMQIQRAEVNEQYQTILRWRDHYKLRYKANLNSRKYHRQNSPTQERQIKEQTESEIRDDDEKALQHCLTKDEWEPYYGRKPAKSDHTNWNDFMRYIKVGLKWHQIKGQTWTTVGFQYGNNILTETFAEATKDIAAEDEVINIDF